MSLDAFHAALIELVDAPVATRPDGALGGVVSATGAVVVGAVVARAVVVGVVVVGAGVLGVLGVVGGGGGVGSGAVVVGIGGGAGVVVERAEEVGRSGAVTAGQGHATTFPASVMHSVFFGRRAGDEELWTIEIWYPSQATSAVGRRVTEMVIVLSCQGGLKTILPAVLELRSNRHCELVP